MRINGISMGAAGAGFREWGRGGARWRGKEEGAFFTVDLGGGSIWHSIAERGADNAEPPKV
jgi:hypothetical protein